MIDTDGIITGIQDFFHRKPLLFSVTAIIVFLFFAGLIVVFIQSSPKRTASVTQTEQFTPAFPPLNPSGPEIEKEYYPSRATEDKWSEHDVKEWFTIPDEEEIRKIEQINEKIISDITEAAP